MLRAASLSGFRLPSRWPTFDTAMFRVLPQGASANSPVAASATAYIRAGCCAQMPTCGGLRLLLLMKRPSKAHGPENDPSPALGTSREFLERVAKILVKCGYRPRQLEREFAAICGKLEESKLEWNPATLGYIADLPHVLTHWHRDPDYVDDHGTPRPLSLNNDGPSLSTLIGRIYPSADPAVVVETLLRIGAIRRVRKRFVPAGRSVVLEDEAVRIHALMALLAILRTIDFNIQHTHDNVSRLLEKTVIIPRFPKHRLEELHQELHKRGEQFATEIDAQLLRSEVALGSQEEHTRVIFGLYVSDGTLADISPAAVSPPVSTDPTRPRSRSRARPAPAKTKK